MALTDRTLEPCLEAIPDAALLVAPDGDIRHANGRAERLFGYPPGRLVGRSWGSLVPPDRRAAQDLALAQVLATPHGASGADGLQTLALRADGGQFQVECFLNPIRTGEEPRALALFRDLGEDQDALRRRARGLTTLLEASQALSATLDLGRVLQATADGAARLVGLDTSAVYLLEDDRVELRATAPALPPDFPEDLRRAPLAEHPHLAEALATQHAVFLPNTAAAELSPAEQQVIRLRDLRSVLFLPLLAGDQAVGALIVGATGVRREVPEADLDLCRTLANLAALAVANAQLYRAGQLHAAELETGIRERERAEEALRHRQEQLEGIVATAPGVVYSFRLRPDGSMSFPFAGPGVVDFCGVPPALLARDPSGVWARIHPEDIGRLREAIAESARTLAPWREEFRVRSPSRGELWLEGRSRPLREPDGSVLWHGVVTDVTDRKRAEAEREALQRQLAQAQRLEAVGRLAGGVAHDFNNMLAVILGRTELALLRAGTPQTVREDLREILEAAERSSALIRQLLAFARRQPVRPRVLDLNEAVGGTVQMLRRLIGEDVDLVWTPGAGAGTVRIDPSQVDQILANLVVNARDAIAGPGRILLETGSGFLPRGLKDAASPQEECAVLTVADDGCGMDAETVAHLFEPFFTTKPAGEGTGLGLATVYGIVRQNSGFVTVESQPGSGTTVRVLLPRAGAERDAPPGPDPLPAPGCAETVLLVEDEEAILDLGREMLETLGYTVLGATRPSDALRLASEHPSAIHLLITDVVMPEMDGRRLAERLRAVRPGLRCLYVSGYAADVVAHRGALQPGVLLLEKPFTSRQLAAKVRAALDGAPDPAAPG